MDVRQDKGMFRWNLQIGLLCGIFVFGGSFRVLRINFLLLKVEDEFWMWQSIIKRFVFCFLKTSMFVKRIFDPLEYKWNKCLSTYNIILHIEIILFYNQRSSFTQTLKHFTKKCLAFTKSSIFTSIRGPTNDFHELSWIPR